MVPMPRPELEPLDAMLLARLDDDGNPLRPNEGFVALDEATSDAAWSVSPLGSDPTPTVEHADPAVDENEIPTALKLTPPKAERRASEAFARNYSAPGYRARFNRLYPLWRNYNATYFDGKLEVPHISIGLTTPRRFSECRLTTDYGGQINITLAARIVFLDDRKVVHTDDPDALGLQRFIADLLLGETVKQFVLEAARAVRRRVGRARPAVLPRGEPDRGDARACRESNPAAGPLGGRDCPWPPRGPTRSAPTTTTWGTCRSLTCGWVEIGLAPARSRASRSFRVCSSTSTSWLRPASTRSSWRCSGGKWMPPRWPEPPPSPQQSAARTTPAGCRCRCRRSIPPCSPGTAGASAPSPKESAPVAPSTGCRSWPTRSRTPGARTN